jgi:hypothetical protein
MTSVPTRQVLYRFSYFTDAKMLLKQTLKCHHKVAGWCSRQHSKYVQWLGTHPAPAPSLCIAPWFYFWSHGLMHINRISGVMGESSRRLSRKVWCLHDWVVCGGGGIFIQLAKGKRSWERPTRHRSAPWHRTVLPRKSMWAAENSVTTTAGFPQLDRLKASPLCLKHLCLCSATSASHWAWSVTFSRGPLGTVWGSRVRTVSPTMSFPTSSRTRALVLKKHFFFWWYWDWAQGLVHSRQVLYTAIFL